MICVACKYAPLELLAGCGRNAVRIDPNPDDLACSESCSHPNMCSYAKAVIEAAKADRDREILLTDCCDAMRRAYDVLNDDPDLTVWFLPLPHKAGEREIARFAADLRTLAQDLSGTDGFDAQKALKAWKRAQESDSASGRSGTYLRLLGAHGGGMLLERIRRVMAPLAVEDDTCTGNRSLLPPSSSPEDFFTAYARALLEQPHPCMRMLADDAQGRGDDPLLAGTIYHTIKFCDYYSFEYMNVRKNTARPVLRIETDTTPQSSGQLQTRLEAFREELGMKPLDQETDVTFQGYVAGIDCGSTTTEVVIMDEQQTIVGRALVATGAKASHAAEQALSAALQDAGLKPDQLARTVTTGYGRKTTGIAGSREVTEISCHALGAHYLDPMTRTVIDIGGQDSKIICIDGQGKVLDFIMNDKCAAGTGRFLETQARALGLSVAQMSRAGQQWQKELTISSTCTVFAESEVISLVAQNEATADIVHGLNRSIANKVFAMMGQMKHQPVYMMTGGVAANDGVVACLQEKIGSKIRVYPDHQYCGAIGAALAALDR
jgi:predicted CoA-substrate-specific enzyme activase